MRTRSTGDGGWALVEDHRGAHLANKPIAFAIDDEVDNLDLIVRCLTSAYEVTTFTNPREAVAAALAAPPAVVVLDYRMPGMNGVEVVRQLRQGGVRCAVVMATGYPDDITILGADQEQLLFTILPKPWHQDDLRRLVAVAVNTQRVKGAALRIEKATRNLGGGPSK